jgi:site-specific DNA-adenine methylase
MRRSGANHNGNQLEKFIEERLVEKGYTFVPRERFRAVTYLEQAIYSRQCFVGKSLYGTDAHCDFVIFHPEKHAQTLIIESKWQQSKGSVDEKYVYTITNIKTRYPYNTILLLDGGGYTKQTEQWIRSQVNEKLLHVFNMAEFQKWSNRGGI